MPGSVGTLVRERVSSVVNRRDSTRTDKTLYPGLFDLADEIKRPFDGALGSSLNVNGSQML